MEIELEHKFILYCTANFLLDQNFKDAYKISAVNFYDRNLSFKGNMSRLFVLAAESTYLQYREEDILNNIDENDSDIAIYNFLFEAIIECRVIGAQLARVEEFYLAKGLQAF